MHARKVSNLFCSKLYVQCKLSSFLAIQIFWSLFADNCSVNGIYLATRLLATKTGFVRSIDPRWSRLEGKSPIEGSNWTMRALSWRSCRCSINCSEAEATKKKRGTNIGGGAWLVRFQGCNKIVNKIVDLTFLVVARVYFWTVDGAWNFYMFQEKPAAPVVYGVLSIARQIRRRPFELLSRADELSRNVSRLSFSRLLSPLPSIYFTSVSATILPSPYERPATLNAALIDGFFSNASSSLIYTSVPSLSSLSSSFFAAYRRTKKYSLRRSPISLASCS